MKTKTIAAALMLFVSTSLFTACSSHSKPQQDTTATADSTTAPAALSIDEVLAQADSLTGKEVSIQGICTHTCKHGATKMFLMGSDDTKMLRVEAGKLGSFDTKCVNSIVDVKGKLMEQRVDEAYLKDWEAQLQEANKKQHGNNQAGCEQEKKARGEQANTPEGRIAAFRQQIAKRKAETGKDYLSFYYVEASQYDIRK